MKKIATGVALLAAAALLAACTEKPQTNAQGVRYDATPWSGSGTQANSGTAFTASGWQPGDKAAWERQIKTRMNGQNEYLRVE